MPTDANAILAAIQSGRTLFIRNALHTWKIDAKVLARFAKLGAAVLKDGAKPGHLLMASGRKFVRIDLCRLDLV